MPMVSLVSSLNLSVLTGTKRFLIASDWKRPKVASLRDTAKAPQNNVHYETVLISLFQTIYK
jgi:hypothetical protein